MKNYFITLEGIEGTGKSTAIKFIHRYLHQKNIPLILTREPGGTKIGDAIREVLLNQYDEKMEGKTELLLMFASRAQNLAQVIRPALAEGNWVLSDRFTDASYAYQGGGRGLPEKYIAQLEQVVHADLQPDITFLLDAPVQVGKSRIKNRAVTDRIEQERQEFFERVRAAYLERAKKFPHRFRVIDASQSLSNVEQQISQVLDQIIV